jgi:uncharacterized protein
LEHLFRTEVVELEKLDYKNPLVLGGFYGRGFTGTVSVGYILEKLGMHEVAHVRSQHIPPVAVFIGGQLRHPFRIYRDKNGSLITIICEVPIDMEGLYEISNVLLSWLEGIQPREIVILDAIPVNGIPQERHVYCAARPERMKQLQSQQIVSAESAMISGIAGALLSESLTRKVPALSLLTEVSENLPDPGAVLSLVTALNSLYNLKIDTKELEQSVSEVKATLSDLMEKFQKLQSSQSKPEKSIYD